MAKMDLVGFQALWSDGPSQVFINPVQVTHVVPIAADKAQVYLVGGESVSVRGDSMADILRTLSQDYSVSQSALRNEFDPNMSEHVREGHC